MNAALHILTIFLISFFKNSLACSLCVNEPLLTSSVKCARCDTCYLKPGDIIINKFETFHENENKRSTGECMETELIRCDRNYKYRTIDGTCNNLKHPSWAQGNTTFLRLLPPNYGDGESSISLASNGEPLPLARKIRTEIFPEKQVDDIEFTLVAMQWGQIVAHDLAISIPKANSIDCCNPETENFEENCLPIIIPDDDPFYSKLNIKCIGEIRTQPNLEPDACCRKRTSEKVNGNTHVMDASLIYGSDIDRSNSLREFKNGRLITQKTNNNRDFLPNVQGPIEENCYIKNLSEPCYRAGDDRVNQNTELTVLQTVLLREHNRIANKLSLRNNWSDEKLFQETRNIIVGIFQHITYKEFLPIYIGENNMIKYNLYPMASGYTRYNCRIKPTILMEFATSAYRFAHSAIQGQLQMFNYDRSLADSINISDFTDRPCPIQQYKNYDQFLLGLTTQPMEAFDRYYSEQMTNLIFHNYSPFGHDLLSLDIQRGRDHGLAPYVRYLEICTGYKARTFEDLYRYIPKNLVDKLKKLYKSVNDIDLHVGGILENLDTPAKFGPTFLCIVLEQFYRTKFADRFWYEVGYKKHSFTPGQLREIRKVTLSRLICDNSDNISTMAENSFRPISNRNPLVNCSQIPSINLDLWK